MWASSYRIRCMGQSFACPAFSLRSRFDCICFTDRKLWSFLRHYQKRTLNHVLLQTILCLQHCKSLTYLPTTSTALLGGKNGNRALNFSESFGLVGSSRHLVLGGAQKRFKKCLLNINLNQMVWKKKMTEKSSIRFWLQTILYLKKKSVRSLKILLPYSLFTQTNGWSLRRRLFLCVLQGISSSLCSSVIYRNLLPTRCPYCPCVGLVSLVSTKINDM